MAQDLYTGEINEFIDWETGLNVKTGESVGKVSGKSIREFLLKKFELPIYIRENLGKYQIFPSEYAANLYGTGTSSDDNELLLLEFDKPTESVLEFNGIAHRDVRYVKYGQLNDKTKIQFLWDIRNNSGPTGEKAEFTISINNAAGDYTYPTIPDSTGRIQKDISDHLEKGVNSITLKGKGVESGVTNTINLTITVVDITVTCDFDFYRLQSSQNKSLTVDLYRNDPDGDTTVYFIIDGDSNDLNKKRQFTTTVDRNTTGITEAHPTVQINFDTERDTQNNIDGLEPGLHSLQIYANTRYSEDVSINSNLLYYTFASFPIEYSRFEEYPDLKNNMLTKHILISTSIDSGSFPLEKLTIPAILFEDCGLNWGYNTYNTTSSLVLSANITWKLHRNIDDENPIDLTNLEGHNGELGKSFIFKPSIISTINTQTGNTESYITANCDETELLRIPIRIDRNKDFDITEAEGLLILKLSAYGKSNESNLRETWESGDYSTTFNNIKWTSTSGWYQNSFRTQGLDQYATINCNPFYQFSQSNSGKTIEIEFKTENVANENDVLIRIGSSSSARIEITPTKATLFSGANISTIYTNYKSNERLKIAFIFNKITNSEDKNSGLIYIVTDGILERVCTGGQDYNLLLNDSGNIKIGGSESGVKVFTIRIYNRALTYTEEYNNFVFDNDDKMTIYERNKIMDNSGEISLSECLKKIDTILITGDISGLLKGGVIKERANVTIERYCPFDTTKNFKVVNALIRKHGQSTLKYPVPSFKIWFNKRGPVYDENGQEDTDFNEPTVLTCSGQAALGLAKNRYKMKDNSIPSNKFVLQANYADSSGCHNGGIQRLIQSTWYNAKIDNKFLLRTEPQLITTISESERSDYGFSDDVLLWKSLPRAPMFPYQIQIAADSFPCVIFHRKNETSPSTYLGQYVFMEDKKSDFLYGERSIYKILNDPFCLTSARKNDDTKENKLWDNGHVLRIEGLNINTNGSSFINADDFLSIEENRDDNDVVLGQRFRWERDFELIYPDPDDVDEDDAKNGKTKFDSDSKFRRITEPFVKFALWLSATRNNYNQKTEWWEAGTYSSFNAAFEATAADHLDLYKMAAYYIFCMRFGLVDSTERNAQYKTYDGLHWHMEPWDMDIALGNKNTGGIAFDPPIDRNTRYGDGYAFSGKSGNTSNTLWDGLELWKNWKNIIVPKVANALYDAGLTYENIINMLENNYCKYWGEVMYNKSGYFKYITSALSGNKEEFNWLQGARTTHRHWWLSTSMDSYDADWGCGDYGKHYINVKAAVSLLGDIENAKKLIITPVKQLRMSINANLLPVSIPQGVVPSHNNPLEIYLGVKSEDYPDKVCIESITAKVPVEIFGANYVESIDVSSVAQTFEKIELYNNFTDETEPYLKTLIVGSYSGELNNGDQIWISSLKKGIEISYTSPTHGNFNSLSNLELLNIRGLPGFISTYNYIREGKLGKLKWFYAAGSGLTDFYSSNEGNRFETIELPDSVVNINLKDTTWVNLEFWSTAIDINEISFSLQSAVNIYYNQTIDSYVPYNLRQLTLNGTTCRNSKSILLVKDWIKSIEYAVSNNIHEYTDYTFSADNIRWDENTVGIENFLTYDEILTLAKINNNMRGYLVISSQETLTQSQLDILKSYFNDPNIFSLSNSGKLIVDYYNPGYLTITMSGLTNGSIEEGTGENGNIITLYATYFMLLNTSNTSILEWRIGLDQGSILQSLKKGKINVYYDDNTLTDCIKILQTEPNGTTDNMDGHDYPLYITCLYKKTPQSSPDPVTTTVNVIAAKYPKLENITFTRTDLNQFPRESGNILLYCLLNILSVFIIPYKSLGNGENGYTARIKNVTYKILRNNNVKYSLKINADNSIDQNSSSNIINSDELEFLDVNSYYDKNSELYGFKITTRDHLPEGSDVVTYVLKASILYESGTIREISKTITVLDDSEIILSKIEPRSQDLYLCIYGDNYEKTDIYKSDLLNLTGTIDFTSKPNLSTLLTQNNKDGNHYLFEYIPNITGLKFNGHTIPKSQLNFTLLPNLLELDVTGCSAFGSINSSGAGVDLDLTSNTHLTKVVTTSTRANVLLPPNSGVTTYTVGYPSKIIIENQNSLSFNNINVLNIKYLDDLQLVNITGNKTFTLFEKIMNSPST